VNQKKSLIPIVLILFVVVLVVGAGALMYFSPHLFVHGEDEPQPAAQLKMGGTATIFLIMENRWRLVYRKEKGVELDYESTGSTKGLTKMIDRDLAVAFTHAPMSDEQKAQAKAKGGDVLHIPIVLCAVVPVYNVKDLPKDKPLKFSGEALGDIFLGKIDKWNDPALKKLNEGVDLPDEKITVVHREDSSGTTFVFTDFLVGASPAWKEKFGKAGSEIAWPVGEGHQRNEGVAFEVKETEGAIGYVDLVHAWNYDLAYGAVENKDKSAFIHAEAANITAAAESVVGALPEDLTFKLTNQPGKDSYPITGAVWAVCYQAQPAAKQKTVVDFLRWATHDGQQFAKNMSYAPLPVEIVERADKKLDSIVVSQ
jgi:phosphate transport system substrate-binding protein